MNAPAKKRIAVLASGHGTNLQAIMDACARGEIQGEVAAVVSNRKYAYALNRARAADIPTLLYENDKYPTKTVMCAKMSKALKEMNIDLICLAGYMMKLEPCLIRSFPRRIVNIHPALLPKYGGKGMYGRFVHEAVLKAQEKESGCTVHVVDEVYDNGPIIAQAKVTVDSGETPDSLAEKIHAKEHALYVDVIKKICNGEINLDELSSPNDDQKVTA